ncbi:2-C-methyl-D-erythritol 4-phosphate cytidylyltransferase [Prochlorococcus sp. MIT 1307]|uniref:2-C-methyl-D-erythritol 4-phosphate cytidylyltransferase n=1 Tax=Prochlorococcus sp. MIT 1307 TaxID=3096219 RepID=UPI002A75AB3B|nr:2-C-methyl-D-erythritol 4-phosphate cytidylyltransferase [Prochlorococcus sp. MIT 1307]
MHLLIAAAGSGTRMGASGNKLLLPVSGRPVLAWTLDAVFAAEAIKWIGIVGQPIDKTAILNLIQDSSKPIKWINGGKTRQESVQLGLSALPPEAKHVLIHDGARCLIEPSLFNRCAEAVLKGNAVIAATPLTDTIKCVDGEGFITHTPERSGLWAAQTPQGFPVFDLSKGHSEALKKGWNVTDDASLFERLGWPVQIMKSLPSNIKVTTPFDLVIAEAVLSRRARF